MVRFVNPVVREAFLALDGDFLFVRTPKASHGTTNQLRHQARRPGAAAFWVADDDDLFHERGPVGILTAVL
jgi:hypothetical protein